MISISQAPCRRSIWKNVPYNIVGVECYNFEHMPELTVLESLGPVHESLVVAAAARVIHRS